MILDTGPLVAAANARDPDHNPCRDLLAGARGQIIVPAVVIAEAAFLIGKSGSARAEAMLLRSLASPRYRVEAPTAEDLGRAAELVEQYADLRLGSTDALVIAAAERNQDAVVATLDHRHFSVVRSTIGPLTLVP